MYPEALGITGIEAIMHGKPVVAFDVGGVSDWLKHKRTGLFADTIDAGSLAAALLRLLRDNHLRQMQGQNARKMAVQAFSAGPYMTSLVGLYERALRA